MGEEIDYVCENCGFEIIENFPVFYYDSNTKSVVEYIILMLTVGMDKNSKIKGRVNETYCPHCNRFLKTYLIEEITCSDYDSKEIIKIIKEGIDNRLKNLKVETKDKINELNQIKDKKKCIIEKDGDTWSFYFPEADDADYYFNYDDFSSKEEMYKKAYDSFYEYIDSEISYEIEECQKNHDAIYNIIDVSSEELKNEFDNLKHIPCPICNNDSLDFDSISCPKCGGTLFISSISMLD